MPPTTNNSSTAATITQGQLIVASPGAPQPLAFSKTLIEAVELTPARDRATQNLGNIWLGFLPANDSQLRLLRPVDQPYVITAPPGKKIDLSSVYIDASTAGDGVIWTAIN